MTGTTQARQSQQGSIAQQYEQMTPEQFGEQIQKGVEFLSKQADLLTNEVQNGSISPVQALQIQACSAGAVYDYEAFHPRAGGPSWSEVQTMRSLSQGNVLGSSDARR